MDYRERWELKDYLIGRTLSRRILIFHAAVVLIMLGFFFDFWYLQGAKAEEYAVLAENNLRRKIPVPPTRGEIYDRRNRVVASTRPSLDLMLRREKTHDLEPQLQRVAPVIGRSPEELSAALREMRRRPLFEPLLLKRDISLEELARIEARRELFPSVEISQTPRRHYPEGRLVPLAVGYVGQVAEDRISEGAGLHPDDIVGKSGIERVYDDTLRGNRGWNLVAVNNLGRQIGSARVGQQPQHGQRLDLTLDLRLQKVLIEAFGDEVGGAVFLDPWSGEVLALASTPTLDPNLFADGLSAEEWQVIRNDERRPLTDRVVASFYAPGSTFKVVMALAGLETGTVTAHDRVFCNGSAEFYGRRRLCWKPGGHGWVEMRRALAESCNVYFYQLGQKLGIEPIHRYGKMLGLGSRSGIDVTGEASGVLPSKEWKQQTHRETWYPGDTISVAIGQGYVAVTPIQMARMISGVATGVTLPVPHLHAGSKEQPQPLTISASTVSVVQEALAQAVRAGTATAATRGQFTVAGKTGTAQVYKHSAGIDSDELPKAERDHAWFVGYAPAVEPRIAFAVVVEHGGHGGSMAAPIARKVLDAFFEKDPALQAGSTKDPGEDRVRPTAAR